MAANNIKCLQFVAAIAVFIAIVKANHNLKENSTLTKAPNSFTKGVETKPYKLQEHTKRYKSAVPSVLHSKTHKNLHSGHQQSAGPNVKATRSLKLSKHVTIKNSFSHHDRAVPKRGFKIAKKLKKITVKKFQHSDSIPHLRSQVSKVRSDTTNKTLKNTKKSPDTKSKGTVRRKRQENANSSKNYKNIHKAKTNKPLKKSKRRRENLRTQTTPNQNNKGKQKRGGKKNKPTKIRKYNDDNSELPSNKIRSCAYMWNVEQLFQDMAKLNEENQAIVDEFIQQMGSQFDKEMLEVMVANRSVSERALHNAGGVAAAVPAGLQLGGYAVLKHTNSLLFFHRLKLRNQTTFFIDPIQSDFNNMVLHANLFLGDLHLAGNYERLKIDKMPSNLYYAPTYGALDFLLRDVEYKLEGRYRVANGRLLVEQVISNITGKHALISYTELPGMNTEYIQLPSPIIEFSALEDFVDRLKIDLNEWVKDYFNDYLMYFGLADKRVNALFELYDKKKTLVLNDFVDYIVKVIRWRLNHIRYNIEPRSNVNKVTNLFNLPEFTIFTVNGMTLTLNHGQVEGLNSIYRRSTATGPSLAQDLVYRDVDAVVGFSDLRVVYKYQAIVNPEGPPMQGQLILTANDLTAHAALGLYKENNSIRLQFDQIYPLKVQALTIEGPVNRMIGSFRHLLENHIVALLTNVLMNQVKEMKTVFKCTGYEDKFHEPFPRVKGFDHGKIDINDNHVDDDPPIDDDELPAVNSKDESGNEGPVTLPENSLEATEDNINEGPVTLPENSLEATEDNINEGPVTLPENSLEATEDNINEGPVTLPENSLEATEDNINEGPVTLPENSLEATEDNINEGPVTLPENSVEVTPPVVEETPKPDLIMEKSDSMELELPQDAEHDKPRQVHVERKEQFKLYEHKGDDVRRWVGRQKIAKKGGKDSRSVLLING